MRRGSRAPGGASQELRIQQEEVQLRRLQRKSCMHRVKERFSRGKCAKVQRLMPMELVGEFAPVLVVHWSGSG